MRVKEFIALPSEYRSEAINALADKPLAAGQEQEPSEGFSTGVGTEKTAIAALVKA